MLKELIKQKLFCVVHAETWETEKQNNFLWTLNILFVWWCVKNKQPQYFIDYQEPLDKHSSKNKPFDAHTIQMLKNNFSKILSNKYDSHFS